MKIKFPKTWEEFCDNYPIGEQERTINTYSVLVPSKGSGNRDALTDRNNLPTQEAAEAHLALMQLHQLRDCYRQGWIPNWNDNTNKYSIVHIRNEYYIELSILYTRFLSFQSKEIGKAFLNNFSDLIEKAGDMI